MKNETIVKKALKQTKYTECFIAKGYHPDNSIINGFIVTRYGALKVYSQRGISKDQPTYTKLTFVYDGFRYIKTTDFHCNMNKACDLAEDFIKGIILDDKDRCRAWNKGVMDSINAIQILKDGE